jgi:ribosome-binding factor A
VSQRKSRVEHALRDALQSAITNDVKDPRVRAATLVTVSKVELNVDLSVANVFVSVVGDDATADGVVAGLAKAAGYLRGPIGRELALQRAPELRFMHDSSIDVSEKLAAIVREDEERARAVGRKAGEALAPEAEPDPSPEPEPTAVPGDKP